jgi:hypothetical protein
LIDIATLCCKAIGFLALITALYDTFTQINIH